ncbi:PhoD-like phosphatase [Prosthecobacter fusiformis]|uniref:PhoD-like phosphatase n=1 Tax=Prosthecobacter fusiformis TaxID=48464 RepID=A0A4R7SSD3_9BACT|nr:alkaline phosphatase D family protein [Prosthecobacter fusiformis]TDU81088.1 PhoD-like phosphatase [Prosthecobacter fusiformis]
MKTCLRITAAFFLFTFVWAHPVPDIPVRTYFTPEGKCTLTVEVDPRCFAADPNAAASLMQPILASLSPARVAELKSQAQALVKKYVEFHFEPSGPIQPDFTFEFTGHDRAPLDSEDDIVVLTGTWETQVPAGSTGWRIRATKDTPLAVVFRNYLSGVEHPKFSVLFPGEISFPFDLNAPAQPLQHIVFGSCLDLTVHPMLDRTLTLPMDLFLFMGDNIYADTQDMAKMREKYIALGQSTFFQGLRSRAPVLATWDDHDFGVNDGGADYPMKKESQKEFLDWLNEPGGSTLRQQEGVYQARTFGPAGKRTQVILLDTRYFRNPLKRVPKAQGSNGGTAIPTDDLSTTLLGDAQWAWLKKTLQEPAELRLIISSIQFAAEASGSESWANFPHEQKRLVKLIADTQAKGVLILSGDRHWCEMSALTQEVPYPLYDFTASSMTQIHKRGTPTPNANRVLPKTFHQPNVGTLDIDWAAADPTLTLRILDEQGAAQIEKVLPLSELKP